ncbi:hypothetical protein HY573_00550 [Candidatus Parcubacteria bacterium]|nr:hypothetical protein [Candidatus Parcubacteria bacterium]MBI4385303.1 hypothetical protein [Candidatus Parcubacteria bacterium]
MRRTTLFAALIALLAILVVAAPPPAIADTKSGSEPILTIASTSGDMDGTILFAITFGGTVFRDDTESAATATWTSFQRSGPTITATAIPVVSTVPTGTATVRDMATPGAFSGQPWRLVNCTGTGTAHDGTDTRKPMALIASTGGLPGQPLRR